MILEIFELVNEQQNIYSYTQILIMHVIGIQLILWTFTLI
jgi:hypothetical protein